MPLLIFASPKGGVGKTTLAAHVAALLARRGLSVLAIDLDPQNALRLHLGMNIRDDGGFCGWLDQGITWRAAVRETPYGVRLLPHGTIEAGRVLALQSSLIATPELLAAPMRDMLSDPRTVVVADTAPGVSAALVALQPLADLVVQVLLADAGSAAMLPPVVAQAQGRGTLAGRIAERTALVLNQVDLDEPLCVAVMEIVEPALGSRLIGAICRDPALVEALAERRLLLDGEAGAGEDLTLLADAIVARLRLDTGAGAAGGRQRRAFAALSDLGLR
jgi:cellulose synthase operon protein YhjQ